MIARSLLPLLIVAGGSAAGCSSTDPCAGVAGSCLALTVTSATITQADTLDITASGAFSGSHPTSAGHLAALPMRVALHLPATASGRVQIGVVAVDASARTLGSGQASTTVTPGQHSTLTVVLTSGNVLSSDMSGSSTTGDLGNIDLGTRDLTGAVCSSADNSCADSSTLEACRADGSGFTMTTCPNGCSTVNGAHCKLFYPSNAVTPADLNAGSGAINIAANTTLNADTGAIDNVRGPSPDTTMPNLIGGVSYQIVSGTAVFDFGSLQVASGITLTLVGTHPVALVSGGDLVIAGIVDARGYSASGTTYTLCAKGAGGPGGGSGVNGGSTSNATGLGAGMGGGGGGALSGSFGSGGGGGGYGAPGGVGGTGSATGGTLGPAYGNLTLIPLLGGSAGGASTGTAPGGGGGGAVQLVSATKVAIGGGAAAGGVNAGGCGGGGAAFGSGGGGAGSGGAILVEAPVVQLLASGVLAANGGGGADGNSGSGSPGSLNAAPAAAASGPPAGGQGGSHGAGFPGITGANGAGSSEGGGGGGGVGRIRINNVSGTLTPDATAILSPATSDLYNTVAVASYGTIDIH